MKNTQEKKKKNGWLQLKLKQAKSKCTVLQVHQLAQYGVLPNPQVTKHNTLLNVSWPSA